MTRVEFVSVASIPLIEGDPGRGLTPSQVPAILSVASETFAPSASALGAFFMEKLKDWRVKH